MPVVKIIEILAESTKSWEDAAQVAVTEASRTVQDIQNVYIQDMKAFVEGDRIVRYRVNAKISFIVRES
jgi:dodecin